MSPPIQIEGYGFIFAITALNSRGICLNELIFGYLQKFPKLFSITHDEKSGTITGSVVKSQSFFNEEERSQQPSLFSLIRKIRDLFYSENSNQLGLYGAFGYDLAFQFEPIKQTKMRSDSQRDLLLYLPDEIIVIDNFRRDAWKISYDFLKDGVSTEGIERKPCISQYVPADESSYESRDTLKGEYTKLVDHAKEQFRVGNLFEVVLRLEIIFLVTNFLGNKA